MPLIYKTKKWTPSDREKLVKAVRSQMQKVVVERTMELQGDEAEPTLFEEVASMSDDALVEATADAALDWEEIVSYTGMKRTTAAACQLQWATVDNPTIRHPDAHLWQKARAACCAETATYCTTT